MYACEECGYAGVLVMELDEDPDATGAKEGTD
jgi:predicted nucleic acid-binding Zn ribbon protein